MDLEQRRKLLDLKRKRQTKTVEQVIEHKLDEQLIDSLKEELAELRTILEKGVDTQSVKASDLIERLERVAQSLDVHKELTALAGVIETHYTSEVSVKGLEDLKKAISLIKPQVKVLRQEDVYATYKPSDSDEATSPRFYGFINSAGEWFILKETGDGDENKTWRYAAGRGEYDRGWADRRRHSYVRYDEVTL